ncbi:MAG TPA: OmpA family protein [Myxococcota bacterium]|nr:OmpA family protein [Myxococcota bacterium]
MNRSRSASLATVLMLLSLLLQGCAGLPTVLRELIDQGANEKAQARGEKWLEGHAGKPKYKEEADVITVLVAEATLNLAIKADTVEAYRAFKGKYSRVKGCDEFLKTALLNEATANYRDFVTKRNDINAYQAFRKEYPGAREFVDSVRREAELALADSLKVPGIEAVRKFLAQYDGRDGARDSLKKAREALVNRAFEGAVGSMDYQKIKAFRTEFESWPEVAPYIARARETECRRGFERAEKSQNVNLISMFRSQYESWPEAAELVARAYDLEAGIALSEAFRARDVARLQQLGSIYGKGTWPEKFGAAVSDVYLERLEKAINVGKAFPEDFVNRFLEDVRSVPGIQARGERLRAELFKTARALKDPPALYLAGTFFSDDPESPKLLTQAEAGYWKVVNEVDQMDRWLQYTRWFPASPRAATAEQRYLWHQEIRNREAFGFIGNITRTIRQPNGDIDVYVDVRDKKGNRVSGLTRDAFRLFLGSLNVEIIDFWGMEDDRPLDIMFAIDMSGSMSPEKQAVRDAVAHFASVLDFRGRDARLGIVSFSDEVIDKQGFSSDSNKFIGWMNSLMSTTVGGAGEDGVQAMMDSIGMLRSSPGERVVIFLSDEPLQVNSGGLERLRMEPGDDCGRARAWVACRNRCQENERKGLVGPTTGAIGQTVFIGGPQCEASCVSKLGREASRLFSRCMGRADVSSCVRDSSLMSMAMGMNRGCGDPVITQGSRETAALIREMDRAQLRPYFIVTPRDSAPGTGYAAIAESLQGRVLAVPDDTRSSEPYVRVLMEIAEQLSRQYVVRYRPNKSIRKDASATVVVRPIHRWSAFGNVPQADVMAMVPTSDSIGCPDFLVFTRTGLFASSGCSANWEDRHIGLSSRIIDARVGSEHVLLLTQDQKIWLYGIADGSLDEVPLGFKTIADFQWEGSDGFWVSGLVPDGSILVEFRQVGASDTVKSYAIAAAERPGRVSGTVFPVVMSVGRDSKDVCMLVKPDLAMCSADGRTDWKQFKVQGLPSNALSGPARLSRISAHQDSMILVAADGSIFRSISNGSLWTRVLDPVPGGRQLSQYFTKPELLCATSSQDVVCSEDGGANFFPLGLKYKPGQGFAMASVGGHPVLASEGSIQRLFRVLNRELPSSAVYFDTNDSSPSASMMPFLRDIANEMRRNPDSHLRIEGHADARGTTQHNEELSRLRAEAIASEMTSMGVERDRLMVVWFGERRPIQAGESAKAHARNRRVELILLKTLPDRWFEAGGR